MASPIARRVARPFLSLMPKRLAIALNFRRKMGYWPDLHSPRTFNEKIQHRKLHDRDVRLPAFADKVEAKRLVAQALGEDWVIPTLWHGTELPPVAQRDWPEIERHIAGWLDQVHADHAGEWLYTKITPQLLVEPFIGRDGEVPVDFKFHVFGGRAEYIQCDTGRYRTHRRTMFTRDWQRAGFELCFPEDPEDIPPPTRLAEMLRAAEQLADGFDYVRVDFYEVDRRPLFGELTFYPGSGFERLNPPAKDLELGRLWPDPAPHAPLTGRPLAMA